VRRHELDSPTSSPRSSPDPAIEGLLRSRAHNDLTYATIAENIEIDHVANSDEDETELRLFATPANAPPTIHKIRLSSPGAHGGEPGFLVKKPRSYYFADDLPSDEVARLRTAAIDAETVMRLAKEPWPGCALPWKVTKISAAGLKKEVLIGHPPTLVTVNEPLRKRKRKGKKTRITIRKRLQASKNKREEQARLEKEKEAAEREKRTRRNREKKVKKKAREVAKKTEGATDGTDEHAELQKIRAHRAQLAREAAPPQSVGEAATT
jgi:hypothetical protein